MTLDVGTLIELKLAIAKLFVEAKDKQNDNNVYKVLVDLKNKSDTKHDEGA
jgi:hypothetical protein